MTFRKTKKLISLLMAVCMIACIICVAVVPASATINDAVRADTSGVMQVRTFVFVSGERTVQGTSQKYNHTNLYTVITGDYSFDNYEFFAASGTAFLINDKTALTCAHVVNEKIWKEEGLNLIDYMNKLRNMGFTVEIECKLVVNKDVTITASVTSQSEQDDYAILELSQSLGGKEALKLADSDKVSSTQTVYSLGFPAVVENFELSEEGIGNAFKSNRTYDSDDVTVSEGSIQKTTNLNNTNVIQHSCPVSNGNSGGPLVDENGAVVGVNKKIAASSSGENFHWATSINEIKKVLDSLNISYSVIGKSTPTNTSEETKSEETKAEETKADAVEPTEAPEPPKAGTNWPLIIGIIAGVILLIAVIAIVVVVVNKNKKKDGQGNQPPAPPMPPTPPVPPMPPVNEGAGETSVLSDGAGETTVLGGGATGFNLIRKSNNEMITINKPEFVIGKERRRVDYCIADNNSVSRTHAKVRVRSGKCYITDLGSTNCTYVNDVKLSPNQEIELKSGDVIKISDVEFVFNG